MANRRRPRPPIRCVDPLPSCSNRPAPAGLVTAMAVALGTLAVLAFAYVIYALWPRLARCTARSGRAWRCRSSSATCCFRFRRRHPSEDAASQRRAGARRPRLSVADARTFGADARNTMIPAVAAARASSSASPPPPTGTNIRGTAAGDLSALSRANDVARTAGAYRHRLSRRHALPRRRRVL